jgi:hypothetical protein
MDDEFMMNMDVLRAFLDFPLQGTSGYRCPEYNAIISSSATGPHTTGMAMDVYVSSPARADRLIRAVYRPGAPFTGIGARHHGSKKKRIFHLDMCESRPDLGRPRPRFWTYA